MNQAQRMGSLGSNCSAPQAVKLLSTANEWPIEAYAASASGAQRFRFALLLSPLVRVPTDTAHYVFLNLASSPAFVNLLLLSYSVAAPRVLKGCVIGSVNSFEREAISSIAKWHR